MAAYRAAQADLSEARARFHDAIRAALLAGVRQVDLVRVTGLTRERIRQISKE